MQMCQFEEVLPKYQAHDEAVRFIQELSKHWPGAPDFVFYNDLEGAAKRLGIDEAVLSKARTLSKKRDIKQGLGVMHPLDCWQLTPRLGRGGRREQFLMARSPRRSVFLTREKLRFLGTRSSVGIRLVRRTSTAMGTVSLRMERGWLGSLPRRPGHASNGTLSGI
jgi:hypothetical protein